MGQAIAEGVEAAEQLAMVRAEGYLEGQGYFFSPPRSASEIAILLALNNLLFPQTSPSSAQEFARPATIAPQVVRDEEDRLSALYEYDILDTPRRSASIGLLGSHV